MDPKNIEKPVHDPAVNELERSVSLCTLCELEDKYLYTDTQVYGLSLPLVELSSTSDDFSSLNFTPECRSVSDNLATVIADAQRYDDIVVDKESPIYKPTKDAITKKKSPIINDGDISSCFLDFVQKAAKGAPDGSSRGRSVGLSWDNNDEKRDNENSQDETALWTDKNFAASEVTKDGIESFISDIDDFLKEDEDETKVEASGETRARQVAPPRTFVSDIKDEIPRKRSKVCATARRFIDTPHPVKFSERFMNLDRSTPQERSKIFAEDFRISSEIISRERQIENGPLQCCTESSDRTQTVGSEELSDGKSRIIADELCRSLGESSPELGNEPEVRKSNEIDHKIGKKSAINVDEEICRSPGESSPKLGNEPEIRKSDGIDHEIGKKSVINVDEEIYRSRVKALPEDQEEIDPMEMEDHAMPLDEAELKIVSPIRPEIGADTFVVLPRRIPLKPRDGNDRAASDDKLKSQKGNVPTNRAISQSDKNRYGDKFPKRIAEPEELPERSKRNRKPDWPEKPCMMEMASCPDYIRIGEDKLRDQSEGVENLITDRVPESPKEASGKKQNLSALLKPEDKEKLMKSWKEVRKDFGSVKDKRPRYPPLTLRNSPPPPDLKIIKERAARRRRVLADAINRLTSLNAYMGEVRNIFRNDNKQYSIIKPTKATNGRVKILVSTSTQTIDGGQHPADSLVVPPSTTVEDAAKKQREEPDITNGGLFCYNLLHTQGDAKDEQTFAEMPSRSAQNDKSGGYAIASTSETDPQNTRNTQSTQNTLRQSPSNIEKSHNLENRAEIRHDMHTYNPLRAQREPKRLRRTALNKKPTPASSKPSLLNRLL